MVRSSAGHLLVILCAGVLVACGASDTGASADATTASADASSPDASAEPGLTWPPDFERLSTLLTVEEVQDVLTLPVEEVECEMVYAELGSCAWILANEDPKRGLGGGFVIQAWRGRPEALWALDGDDVQPVQGLCEEAVWRPEGRQLFVLCDGHTLGFHAALFGRGAERVEREVGRYEVIEQLARMAIDRIGRASA